MAPRTRPVWDGPAPNYQKEGNSMPRRTKAQIGLILADYDAAIRDQRKAEKRATELKAEIRDLKLKDGTYGTMTYALGTPREILDQQRAKELLKGADIPVPTAMTTAPIVVKPIVK
jgi:hypothetical protein